MPTGQQYATNVPQTQLTSSINATVTSMSVTSATGWPSPPFTAVIDLGTSSQEPVDVTAVVGTSFTITRSIDGTSAFAHSNGATVTHADIGRDFRETRAHIDATGPLDSTGHQVHGLSTGAVVGTSDAQTLSNKTISVGTYTGNQSMGGGSWFGSGPLTEASLSYTGISGATAQTIRLAGSHASGPPTVGTFVAGDIVTDSVLPVQWICTAGGSPGTWVPLSGKTLIASQVLGGPAASVTFSSIPGFFHSLQLVASAKTDGTATQGYDSASIQFNGITSSNYQWNSMFTTQGAAGVSVAGGQPASAAQCAEFWNSHFSTAGRGIAIIDIPNYADTNNAKVFTSTVTATDGGAVSIMQSYSGGLLATTSTAAITSLKIFPGSANFIADSTFYLYGIW